MLTTHQVRELMGRDGEGVSDADLEALRDQIYALANDALDLATVGDMMTAPAGSAEGFNAGGPR